MASSERTKPASGRPSVLRFLDRLGLTEWLVYALTVVVGVWSWQTYVVAHPQHVDLFMTTYFVTIMVGALIQTIFAVYVRQALCENA